MNPEKEVPYYYIEENAFAQREAARPHNAQAGQWMLDGGTEMKFGMRFRRISVVLSAVFLLTGCAAAPQNAPPSGPAVSAPPTEETRKDAVVVKVANFFAETHPANQALNEIFKPMLEKKTDGRYIVEVYPNYVLGGEAEITRAAMEGTIEIALSGVIMSDEFPKMKVMDFPWVFSDIDSSYAAINSQEAIAVIDSDVQSVGLRCLGFVLNGVRSISNNKHPIYSVEDCAGIKIRVPEAAQFVDNAEALGFDCESMSIAEIFTALQQGVIDGQENPPTTLLTSGWYTEQDYLALTKHQITYNWLAVNSDFYNGMPP